MAERGARSFRRQASEARKDPSERLDFKTGATCSVLRLDTGNRERCFPPFSKYIALVPRPYMALKIRLSRIGSTHNPNYHVVVAEARSRRDGAATEILGTYNPRAKTEPLRLKLDRADYWLSKGAKPTDTANGLIKTARKSAAATAATASVEAAPAA